MLGVLLCAMVAAAGCHRPPLAWTPSPPSPPAEPPREYDILPGPTDYNGSPLQPRWAPQSNGRLPPLTDRCRRAPFQNECTSQKPSLDTARFPNVLICAFEVESPLKGHANWTVASSVGELLWLNFATDRDFNFMFFPDGDAGLTGQNGTSEGLAEPVRPFIELEFDSRETVTHFATDWWKDLEKVARRHRRGAEIQKFLNPEAPGMAVRAVVYGLFGLDCEHRGQSEFHPVYAMAIEIDPAAGRNRWALFVRNWGNEGFCSSLDHQLELPDGRLRLTLPRRGTRPSVNAADTQFASTGSRVPFPEVAFDALDGDQGEIVLTFTLPPAAERVNAELILALEWPSSPPPRPTMRLAATAEATLDAGPATGPESPERYLDRAFAEAGMSRDDVERRLSLAAAEPAARNAIQPVPSPVPVVDFVRPSPARAAPPRQRLAPDTGKATRDRAIIAELCRAANGMPRRFNGRDVSAMCRPE